jgi:DNA replication protein DnaC
MHTDYNGLLLMIIQQYDGVEAALLQAIICQESGDNRWVSRVERLKLLCQPKLLIIDEIGYLSLDKRDATCIVQLVFHRYERGSIILTSNKSSSDWGAIFAGDSVIASAILDRLLHHSSTINIKGESYPLKDKRWAGLIQLPTALPEGGDAMA